nr:hypothetical protein [Tanacetum cinerariifolium]
GPDRGQGQSAARQGSGQQRSHQYGLYHHYGPGERLPRAPANQAG